MNKNEAKEIISSTFSNDFDEDRYKKFVANLFKKYSKSNFEPNFKDAYKPYIKKYKIIGNYTDKEKNRIGILQVNLSKKSTLEQARTAQRNFVAEYLKSRNKQAALVAFISPNNKEWRLSLVKLEHSLQVMDEKLKTKEEITPAKRWSFLVGESEGSHTAQSRFIDLLLSKEYSTLAELEQAFDIETVTKEFFNRYTKLYFQLKDHLDDLLKKDEKIKNDFEKKEISTVDFAKKTLGQIVFLYFLQKKGWFGVSSDKKWGDGPKKFLRELFEKRKKYGANFFNDILEPLFYEALAQDRGIESIYPRLNNCRMPFLNGGLFEPMNGYVWETTNMALSDEFFSNDIKNKKTGDIGNGILDIFDRYNFTVNENEPLEKEVAVDPEMLGKVFENLLDIKDRKSKGAFYTPREIVHYMCQESLINYLEVGTNSEILRKDLEFFIHKGDRIIENDKITLERKAKRDKKYGIDKYKDSTYSLLLSKSVRTKANKLDELLQNIKVADPAVGSGAFPLGMINEIVRARKVLNVYIKNKISDYELKKHTITHSIYGVDIDPGAVDIAKLRLWLALVVDEETPHPLPNLEHKIMQGNSLLSEYEGIKLFDENILKADKNKESEQLTLGLGKTSAELRMESLQEKIASFVNESQKTRKQNLKKEIDNLKWELIEETLKEQGKESKLEKIKKLRQKNIRPFFIWELEFSDVFKAKGGFDVVIGNPPYTKLDYIDSYDVFNLSTKRLSNSYAYFMEKSLSLISNSGDICFIVPNTWLSIDSCKKLREYFIESARLKKIVETFQVFKSMSDTPLVVDTLIYNLSKFGKTNDIIFIELNQKKNIEHRLLQISNQNWELSIKNSSNFKKIDKYKFIQKSSNIKIETFPLEEKRNSRFLVRIGCQEYALNGGSPNQTKDMIKNKIYHSNSKKDNSYYKFLQCRNIQRYYTKEPTRFLKWGKNLHCPREKNIYSEDHLLVSRIFDKKYNRLKSSFVEGDDIDFCINNTDTFNVLMGESSKFDLKYILALLNSLFIGKYLLKSNINLKRSVYPKINTKDLKKIPIAQVSLEEQQPFIELVNQIFGITSSPKYDPKSPPIKQKELENKIDQLVYKLYGLTPEEIKIVENTAKN